jgi:hypothetical protein
MIHFEYQAGATRHITMSHTAKSIGMASHHHASSQSGSTVNGRYGPCEISGSGKDISRHAQSLTNAGPKQPAQLFN